MSLNTASARSLTDVERSKFTVVKLGGSLLDLDHLVDRLLAVVADLETPVVVVGGGPAVDRVRQWAERGLIDNSEAHRLAIAAMSFNALHLDHSDSRLFLVTSQREAEAAASRGQLPLLDVVPVLRTEQAANSRHPRFPESWDVTSDSIAAWLAQAWNADLWLLKSVDAGANPAAHLDDWFPTNFAGIGQLTWLNLRSTVPASTIVPLPIFSRRSR